MSLDRGRSLLPLIAATLLGGLLAPGSWAQAPADPAGQVLGGIVGVEARVPETARSATVLGIERTGSGVVIDGGGLVVTVGYLVLEARSVDIILADARRVPARVLAYDNVSGLGLLRAERPLEVRVVPLGDSDRLEPRDPVLVASSGGVRSVQPAVLVSRRAFAGYWEYLLEDALFTAPAHPRFGGAALLDRSGMLVGIGSLAVSDALPGPRPMPGNVFIPVALLRRALPSLLLDGRPPGPARPWLGIYADDALGPVVVRRIAEDGPAARSSLRVGDVLVGVADRPVTSLAGFYRELWSGRDAGDTVDLVVLRGEDLERIEIRSTSRYDWLERAGE